MSDLNTAFDEYFEVISANTQELREQVFRLRYQVYCEEIKLPDFEPWKFAQDLEIDEFDDRSVHYLMRHRPSGKIAGTVRLVLADSRDPNQPFPIEHFASHYFDPALIDPTKLPRRHTAEISRLILAKDFRSRKQEFYSPYGADTNIHEFSDKKRRRFPHPVLGLLVSIVRMSAEQSITHWYAGMEPMLNRLLGRFGLNLRPIGPVIEYHGTRQPYLGLVSCVLDRVYEQHREVWELLTDYGRVWPAPVRAITRERYARTGTASQ